MQIICTWPTFWTTGFQLSEKLPAEFWYVATSCRGHSTFRNVPFASAFCSSMARACVVMLGL